MVCPDNTRATGWLNINDVPSDQRGSLFVWLNHGSEPRTRKLIIPPTFARKVDELGSAIGCTWKDYLEWYMAWDGQLVFPSIVYSKTKESLSIHDCDRLIAEGDDSDELYSVKSRLLTFMLTPYRHETIKLDADSPKTYTWYELEKELEDAHNIANQDYAYGKLFLRLQKKAKLVADGILLSCYNYKSKYDGKAS